MAYTTNDYLSSLYGSGTNLYTLSSKVNQFNRNQQNLANLGRIPGAPGLEAQSSENIQAELAGLLPEDVVGFIGQQAAERGVGRGPGMTDAPSTSAAYLRALGLTSRDQAQRGQENLTAAYARNPGAPLFDVQSQMISPFQAAQLELERQRLNQQRKAEQDRLKLERERMAVEAQMASLRSYGGGGGGTRGGTAGTGTGGFAAPTGGGGTSWGDLFSTRGTIYSDTPTYFTGAGTTGTIWDALASGSYVDPTTGTSSIYDPTVGSWYDTTTGTYGSVPVGTSEPGTGMTAQEWAAPASWGYQPTGAGTMYMGTLEGYQG